MSLKYGFYPTEEGTIRDYTEDDIGGIFDGFITDGIYYNIGNRFHIHPSDDGSHVIVDPGRGWFNHTYTLLEEPMYLNLPTGSTTPVDVFLVVNKRQMVNSIEVKDHNEEPIELPGIYYYKLATISNTITPIEQSSITSYIGLKDGVPYVTCIPELLLLYEIMEPLIQEWNKWSDETKDSWLEWMTATDKDWLDWFKATKSAWTIWFNATDEDWDTWFEATKSAWTTWFGNTKSDWTTWFEATKQNWTTWFDATKNAWTTWMNMTDEEWDTWFEATKNEWKAWYDPIKDNVATKQYVDKAIADLINGAPETLDTLKEIADAIAENKTVVDALNDAIGKKVNKTDVIDVEHGGTGKTNAQDAFDALVNGTVEGADTEILGDDVHWVSERVNAKTQSGINSYCRRKLSKLWEYIKGKFIKVVSKTEIADTTLKPGFYDVRDGEIGYGMREFHTVINMGEYSNYRSQISMPYQQSLTDSEAYIRTSRGGEWRPWRRLLHSGNFESIVGDQFVKKSGDTMSGGLTITCYPTSEKGIGFITKTPDDKVEVWMGVGNSRDSHGVFSRTLNKWIAYAKASTGKIVLNGKALTADKLETPHTIDGVTFNGGSNISHYGVCSTVAATAAKVVSLAGFTLATGASIKVKFAVTNTAANPTLNVNGTGAKPIYYKGAAIAAGYLVANRTYDFVYNGTQYDLVGDVQVPVDEIIAIDNETIKKNDDQQLYVPALKRVYRATIQVTSVSTGTLVISDDYNPNDVRVGDLFICTYVFTSGVRYFYPGTVKYTISGYGTLKACTIYASTHIVSGDSDLKKNGNVWPYSMVYMSPAGWVNPSVSLLALSNINNGTGALTFHDLTDMNVSPSIASAPYNSMINHIYAKGYGLIKGDIDTIDLITNDTFLLVARSYTISTGAIYGSYSCLLSAHDIEYAGTAGVQRAVLGNSTNTGITMTVSKLSFTITSDNTGRSVDYSVFHVVQGVSVS